MFKKSKEYRENQLIKRKYKKFNIGADLTLDEPDADGTYNYLSSMPIDSFGEETIGRLQKELSKYKQLFKDTKKTSEQEMWNKDLTILMDKYTTFNEEQTKIVVTEREAIMKKK